MFARLALSRLLRRDHGIAATEFALVLPLMVAAWLGMAQLIQLSEAANKTSMAAQSLSDLAAQANPPLFADAVNAAAQIYAPLPTGSALTVDMVGITFNSGGTPTQQWRCTSGSNADSTVPLNLANGLGNAGQSVIMVTVKYNFTPTITGGVLGPQTYTERSFNPPRLGSLPAQPC